jgi:hypothetical protein
MTGLRLSEAGKSTKHSIPIMTSIEAKAKKDGK